MMNAITEIESFPEFDYMSYVNCNNREIHMNEYIDLRMMKHIIDKIDPLLYSYKKDGTEPSQADIKSNITIIKKYYSSAIRVKQSDGSLHPHLAYVPCVYHQKKYPLNKTTIKFGRYYTDEHSLTTLHRVIRHSISKDFYWDIDVKNAHPTFLVWLCKRNGFACDKVEYYINNREKCFQDLLTTYGVEKELAKMDMLAILNGGESKKRYFCS